MLKINGDSDLMQKIQLSTTFLDEIIAEAGFFSAGLVRDGHILATSAMIDSKVNFHRIVRNAEPLMKIYGAASSERVADFQLQCTQRKVFLQRLPTAPSGSEYWVIVSMNPNRLYFRRFIDKKIKKIAALLFNQII